MLSDGIEPPPSAYYGWRTTRLYHKSFSFFFFLFDTSKKRSFYNILNFVWELKSMWKSNPSCENEVVSKGSSQEIPSNISYATPRTGFSCIVEVELEDGVLAVVVVVVVSAIVWSSLIDSMMPIKAGSHATPCGLSDGKRSKRMGCLLCFLMIIMAWELELASQRGLSSGFSPSLGETSAP